MKQYGVYYGRVLILNPKTKKDALFTSKREADLLAQEMNMHNAGYFTAPIIKPVKAKAAK